MKPIHVTTCEFRSKNRDIFPIAPTEIDKFDLFRFYDPFELRRAVVPVFMSDASDQFYGMGTAFHVDGFGAFLTAHHVIEPVQRHHMQNKLVATEERFASGTQDVYSLLLYGVGVVFGTVGIPDEAIGVVESIYSLEMERDDPLFALQGKKKLEAATDIAVIRPATRIPEYLVRTVPIRVSGKSPCIGDYVVALGFPELDCQPIDKKEMRYLLSEGMYAAYGKIIGIHTTGRGGDLTPILEVEANWPGGMSGGPVFNEDGEVIGMVSRSIAPTDEFPGNGSAVFLKCLPWLQTCIPALDGANPGWRRGWATLKHDPWHLPGFYETKDEALTQLANLTSDYCVAYGSNRIGTDDFVHMI